MADVPASETVDTRDDQPILRVSRLAVFYGNGACGVHDFDLNVRAGEIVALLGRNGAGKSSTLRGIAGVLRSERMRITGSVMVGNTDVVGRTPMYTSRHGLTLVPERNKVFPDLTVEEHLRLVGGRRAGETPCAFEALEGLKMRKGGLLSGGERQMLALEMAWRSKPKILLIDELSLGLAPIIVRNLMAHLKKLVVEQSIATVVVEQDAPAAMAIADRLCVLRDGALAWSGTPEELDTAALISDYVGSDLAR